MVEKATQNRHRKTHSKITGFGSERLPPGESRRAHKVIENAKSLVKYVSKRTFPNTREIRVQTHLPKSLVKYVSKRSFGFPRGCTKGSIKYQKYMKMAARLRIPKKAPKSHQNYSKLKSGPRNDSPEEGASAVM